MTALIIIGAIVVGIVSFIVDEGSFLTKFTLAALVAALGFVLMRWITGLAFMATIAKICGGAAVLATLVGIIGKIMD